MTDGNRSHKTTFKEAIHYYVDNYLAKGSSALFLSLMLTFLAALATIGLLRIAIGFFFPGDHDILKQLWLSFLQMTAPGNMNQDTNSPLAMKLAAISAIREEVRVMMSLLKQ